jgi:hypothetical protein
MTLKLLTSLVHPIIQTTKRPSYTCIINPRTTTAIKDRTAAPFSGEELAVGSAVGSAVGATGGAMDIGVGGSVNVSLTDPAPH